MAVTALSGLACGDVVKADDLHVAALVLEPVQYFFDLRQHLWLDRFIHQTLR
jgi:hypothetical protein